jgi:glycosyltransferase involved in cell wall biosynthesis
MNDETGLVRRIDRLTGAWADDVEVAVSDFILEQMQDYPHAPDLVRIHNGVDVETYAPGPERGPGAPFTVGFVGRLIEGKGVDHLLRALAVSDARLLVAGDGSDRSRLVALARELKLQDRVQFLGTVDDVNSFWTDCDIAVVPTAELSEAFSMVTLEAMACGKPVLAASSGAIPELVLDGKTGILVAGGDATAIAEALGRYEREPELRRRHGGAARERAVEHFRIEKTAASYLELFTTRARDRR